MSLPVLDPEFVISLAREMEINVKKDGSRQLWPLSSGQEKAIRETLDHEWTFHAKPRQEGMSTVHDFIDAVWAWVGDEQTGNLGTNIILDTSAKATKQLNQVADFLRQMAPLGVRFNRRAMSNRGPERIEFPNGSVIVAEGVNGSRVASSYSYHRYHLSELPYWNRGTEVWTSIKPALADDGLVVIETTCDVSVDQLTRNLWYGDNEFKKVFYCVEDFDRHQRDASELTEEQWAWAQEEGFTDKRFAAWWAWALENEAVGDFAGLCHAYPQKVDHLFMSGEGKFIRCQPAISPVIDTVTIEGEADSWKLEVYRKPEDTSGQCIIGVDTSAGKALDHSAVAVIDKEDGQIVACFMSDLVWGDDLAAVAARAQAHYTRIIEPKYPGQPREVTTPLIIVEENGIGNETMHAVRRLGVPSAGEVMTEAKRLEGLLLVKRAAERGELYGPRDFADEADSLHRDELGRFKGRKDLCMAIGFCLRHMRVNAYAPPPVERDRERFNPQRTMRRERGRGRTI